MYDSGSEKRECERELEDESVEDVDSISIRICKYYSCQKKKIMQCKENDPWNQRGPVKTIKRRIKLNLFFIHSFHLEYINALQTVTCTVANKACIFLSSSADVVTASWNVLAHNSYHKVSKNRKLTSMLITKQLLRCHHLLLGQANR